MQRIRSAIGFIVTSYKRLAAIMVIAAILLAIPITTNFLSQQQDLRQRASGFDASLLPQGFQMFDSGGTLVGQVIEANPAAPQPIEELAPPTPSTFQPDMGWPVINDGGKPIGRIILDKNFVVNQNVTPSIQPTDVIYKFYQPTQSYTPIDITSQPGAQTDLATFIKKPIFDSSGNRIGQTYLPLRIRDWYNAFLAQNSTTGCIQKPSYCSAWWSSFFTGNRCITPAGGWCTTSPTPTPIAANVTPTTTGIAEPGQSCGGNMANAKTCDTGYICKNISSALPVGDVGGICVPNTSPSITCIPRPACLDATPRCLIAEPANGWCPSSVTPEPTIASTCGDGVCQQVTCLGLNCPSPETRESCPQDCSALNQTTQTVCNDLSSRYTSIISSIVCRTQSAACTQLQTMFSKFSCPIPNITPLPTPVIVNTTSTSCTPIPGGCIRNGQNICQFFAAPPGGWCPITTGTPGPIACPMLAKVCPDGSSISPSGPNCTFPACPGAIPTPGIVCAEVITFGKNVATGETQQFMTSCLPTGWVPVGPPTSTPVPTSSSNNGQCALKSKGDANCDGLINTDDFNIWRDSFLLDSNPSATPPPSFLRADFNGNGGVDTDDFNIWRDGFLSINPNPTNNPDLIELAVPTQTQEQTLANCNLPIISSTTSFSTFRSSDSFIQFNKDGTYSGLIGGDVSAQGNYSCQNNQVIFDSGVGNCGRGTYNQTADKLSWCGGDYLRSNN